MRNAGQDYGRNDEMEEPLASGGWRGVDMESHPTLVPPDLVWWARNKRFNRRMAEDRMGVAEIEWEYLNVLTSFFGAMVYRAPETGLQWVLRVDEDGVAIDRPESSGVIALPEGVTISASVVLVQANNKVMMFRGAGLDPLVWVPESDPTDGANAFAAVPAHSGASGVVGISQAASGIFHQRRLWLVHSGDEVAVSDQDSISDYLTLNDFFVEKGAHDTIVQLYPFGGASLVVFKSGSLHILSPTDGENVETGNQEITRELGLASYGAAATMGSEVWFLSSNAGLQSLRLALDNKVQSSAESLSRAVAPVMKRLNAAAAGMVRLAFWDGKLYMALPLDAATENNAVLVYDRASEAWQGLDQAAHISPMEWLKMNYQGRDRLFFCDPAGALFLYEEGTQDYYAGEFADVAGDVILPMHNGGRGYWRFTEGCVDLATGNNASASISVAVNGAAFPD